MVSPRSLTVVTPLLFSLSYNSPQLLVSVPGNKTGLYKRSVLPALSDLVCVFTAFVGLNVTKIEQTFRECRLRFSKGERAASAALKTLSDSV